MDGRRDGGWQHHLRSTTPASTARGGALKKHRLGGRAANRERARKQQPSTFGTALARRPLRLRPPRVRFRQTTKPISIQPQSCRYRLCSGLHLPWPLDQTTTFVLSRPDYGTQETGNDEWGIIRRKSSFLIFFNKHCRHVRMCGSSLLKPRDERPTRCCRLSPEQRRGAWTAGVCFSASKENAVSFRVVEATKSLARDLTASDMFQGAPPPSPLSLLYPVVSSRAPPRPIVRPPVPRALRRESAGPLPPSAACLPA